MILKILEFPNMELRKVSKPIVEVTEEFKQLAKDMLETMHASNGIGLAAPQVGKLIRLIVVDTGLEKPIVLFNPNFKGRGPHVLTTEACLSVPNFVGDVKRVNEGTVGGLDIDGNEVEMEVDGLLAVCIQHEIDHLNGKLFIDRVASLGISDL